MDQTLDYGMWLHHHYMETSHSRYATAIKFGQLIEEVEQEDVRMGKSPLVEGTGLKFPSWIRAAEALIPELEGLNAAQQAAELKWTEAELERVRNMIVEEGKAARQLVAVTDPFAGISPEEEPVAPEALEELFGDEDTLLPGVEIEIYSTEMMDELVGMSVADKRLQGMVSKENVVADSLRKLSAASGAPMAGAVVRANNITERVRRQEELAQSQKLEALGQLSGGVAHDFNNFLQVIMGYTELLRSYVETTPSAAKYLEQILRASGQANALTTQLLAFARQQHIAPKVFDLNQHLQLNANMLLHLVGEHIEVITRWDVPVTKVKMDPSQVNQMMMNLVINARDAMPKGGKLTISTCKISAPSPEMGTPAGLKQGDYCRLQIADTGVGMSSETMNRIFEPLFTTKPVGKGTGFGLAICYGIVKQAEGVIHAESELGRGSTFSIYLPSCDETLSHSETPEREANLHRSSATILLVEDDVAVRDITANILEAHGYRPLVAHSPRHAIEIARDNDAIDLLLTDVVMPQLNGKQVSDAVTALRPQIKVLFMSGYALDVFDSQEIQLGGLNLLQKPFSPNQLAQAIRETLDSPA